MCVAVFNVTLASVPGLWLWLGQTTRIEQATGRVNFYLIVLTCTFLALAVIGLIARKLFSNPIDSGEDQTLFNLSDLRRMHRDGELTDDEYLVARAAVLAESGVYSDTEKPDTSGSDSGVTPQASPDDAEDRPKVDPPTTRPGVELGPELLDTPETPPESEPPPDNPG